MNKTYNTVGAIDWLVWGAIALITVLNLLDQRSARPSKW